MLDKTGAASPERAPLEGRDNLVESGQYPDVCRDRVAVEVPSNHSLDPLPQHSRIALTTDKGFAACPFPLRRVVVWDSDGGREIVLVRNNLAFTAKQIADIYKDRWQVELFFKKFKQNLRITPPLWEPPSMR